jgi:hypothetical protein
LDAVYDNYYNPQDGYIVASYNIGPKARYKQLGVQDPIFPDITKWSDVVFIEWQAQAERQGVDIGELKWVFRYQIDNDVTREVIQKLNGGWKHLQSWQVLK